MTHKDDLAIERMQTIDLGPGVPEPKDVAGLSDVRAGIDAIDAEIIALLGLRAKYVLAAAEFKPDISSIPAPERVREMLDQRESWAESAGLSPDFIGPLFAQVIEWFIRKQIAYWPHRKGK